MEGRGVYTNARMVVINNIILKNERGVKEMSKSILVIDTPEICIDCPCHFTEESGMVMCGVEEKRAPDRRY